MACLKLVLHDVLLPQTETRTEFSEREVVRLQKLVEQLEGMVLSLLFPDIHIMFTFIHYQISNQCAIGLSSYLYFDSHPQMCTL